MTDRWVREQVPLEQTWRLEDLYPSVQAWEADLLSLPELVNAVEQYRGRLHESAPVLLACLQAHEKFFVRMMRVATFAQLRETQDGTNAEYQEQSGRVGSAMAVSEAALSFVESEILSLPDGLVEKFVHEEAGLAVWRKTLQDLSETKPHRLHAQVESALAALGEVLEAPALIYERSKSADLQFAPITVSRDGKNVTLPMSFALYEERYELSADTDERRAAYASFVNTLSQYQQSYAAAYNAEVKKQVTLSRLRHYPSVTHMLLHPQRVTMEMYHMVHDIILTELAPHMRRLAKLRQRAHSLPQMRYCDLHAPLDPQFAAHTSYEEATKLILEATAVLGDEYVSIMQAAIRDRWVDRADNVGKASGAFCADHYEVHPYILMTWTDNMRSAFTLAHELGHAGHAVLASRHQRPQSTWPSLYFTEAPSTMNERLLAHHVIAHSTDQRMRLWVIEQSLGTYYHNFVTHLLEAQLQRRVYALAQKGQSLTAQLLSELKGEVLASFWGDAVVIDEGARLTWMRQSHYYMGLYPYTYAAGLTISTAAAQRIMQQGEPAAEAWLSALKAGGSLDPLDLARLAGVDMSTEAPIRSAVAYVGSLVDELEGLS